MALNWTDFINGEGLLSVRNKINAFSNSVVTDVNAASTAITTLVADMITNTAAIASNAAAIATNVINIATNTAAIALLNVKVPFAHSYHYNKANNITVTGDVYEEIIRLTTPSLDAGTYELAHSMLYTLNSITTSAFFRFTIDGGATWTEVRREPKDNLDIVPLAYSSTLVHAGGVFEVIIQSRKEILADTLTVLTIDVNFERKL